MKKILSLCFCFSLLGCASGPSLRGPEISPLGIATITALNDIGWLGEKKNSYGLIGNLLDKAVDEVTGEEVEPILEMTEKALLETMQTSKVNVIPPNEIKSSSGYKSANENKNMKKGNNIAINGYKLIAYNDKTIVSELSSTLGLKGVMFVNCAFDKFMESGLGKNGKMGAAVTLNIFIVNEENKVVLRKSFLGQSENTTAIVGGVYSPEELMSLFPEAIKNALYKFQQSIEI